MPVIALIFGRIFAMASQAARGLIAFLSKLSPAQRALLVVALVGIGFHIVDQRKIHRLEKHNRDTDSALGRETDAHKADIARWKAASDKAAALNTAVVTRIESQQATISKRTIDDYQTQLAALRARFERLRRASPSDQRAPDGGALSPDANGASGTNDPAGVRLYAGDRLLAAEIALRLKALQDWVRQQSAINPNETRP